MKHIPQQVFSPHSHLVTALWSILSRMLFVAVETLKSGVSFPFCGETPIGSSSRVNCERFTREPGLSRDPWNLEEASARPIC